MSFSRYISSAFNARPWGMPIPPNWLGLAGVGILGLLNPGFWIIGAGAELAYLLALASNRRFQQLVDGRDLQSHNLTGQQQVAALLGRLDAGAQQRYRDLEKRCRDLLEQLRTHDWAAVDMQTQSDGLARLLFVYLKLLLTRQTIARLLDDATTKSIDLKVKDVSRQLELAKNPDLQKSLRDQLEILNERGKRHAEAREKVEFIDAELTRIQEQVELIREGIVVTADPATLSNRIDSIGDTLNSTSQWIKQQQSLYGATEELLNDPPPINLETPVAEK